jgi:hypothetical protein
MQKKKTILDFQRMKAEGGRIYKKAGCRSTPPDFRKFGTITSMSSYP